MDNNATLIIEGDLTLQPNASTTLDGSNAVQVVGGAMLDGVLVLELDELPASSVQVLQAGGMGGITGDFTSISANVAGLRSCERASAARDPTQSSSASYSVLVMVDDSACAGGGFSAPTIAGLAAGGVLLLLAAITTPVCIRWWKRKKHVEAQLQGLNNAL